MTAADELRQAAQTLREAAHAATPGPWRDTLSVVCGYPVVIDPLSHNALSYVAQCQAWRGREDATYIALMDPTVGLALADLLDFRADTGGFLRIEPDRQSLAVARAINGDAIT